jgi:hypothetical protein
LLATEKNDMRISKALLILVILALNASLQISCRDVKHWATYTPHAGGPSIAVELVSIHAFLAEYDRFAVIMEDGKEVVRKKLFPDSGGYAATNLHRCGPHKYMLKGYFDTWILDLATKTIIEGKCEVPKPEYIGIFEGGGNRPWKFYSASERKETLLEPKGG